MLHKYQHNAEIYKSSEILYEKAIVKLAVPSLHGTALAPVDHCTTAANAVRVKVLMLDVR